MADDLPFKAEYSKSNRASCKKCKCKIDKDVLRLAAMIQSFRHDGKDPHWYHFECFFTKHRPRSFEDFDGVHTLRPEDQKIIREKVGKGVEVLLPEPSTSKGKKSKKRKADEMGRLKDFKVEYAKSGRSTCAGCGNVIANREVRVIYTCYETEVGERYGGQAFSHHPGCFNEIRGNYNFYLGGADLPGLTDLEKDDQKMIRETIKPIELTESQAKKLKAEPISKKEAEALSKLEKKVEKQGKQLYKVIDAIKKITTKTDLQNILFVNNSGMVVGENALLERCGDFLTFGALEKCPTCLKGDLLFGRGGYTCNGNIDDWTPCTHYEEKPARRECKIPKELKNAKTETFFSKYKPKVEDRAVLPRPPEVQIKIKKGEGGEREWKVQRGKEPLYGMHLVVLGKTEIDKKLIKQQIEKMGGRLVTKLQDKIAAVISNTIELEKMNKRMEEVQELQIQVVPESFLEAVAKGTREEAIEKIKSMAISSWGSDPILRIPLEEEMKMKTKESIYETKAGSSKQQVVKLKNGSALDPESGLEDVAHVYRDNVTNKLYTTVLNLIDITKNKNSFYKMQVLESDVGNKYWLFRSWGRIGTKVGEKKCETHYSAEETCMEFEALYKEKTGNMWGSQPFRKLPGKYAEVDVDYTDDDKIKQMEIKSSIPSKLPSQVQDIIKLMFDVEAMKQTMMEFELDLEKMPLGRLSKKQLEEAYSVLNQLDTFITEGAKANSFIGASNKFFSLVPHSFGMNAAPIIDTVEKIQSKREMIDSLLEIEVAYSIINDDSKENVNPLDSHYEKLKTDMTPLSKDGEEFALIRKYVENTHAATHDQYKLEVAEVFKVSRKGEKRRFKPFNKLHNRQLLWHGSRVTNFAGILSHGLKIAPPEAPCTGYMFGKGIYFADMVSKSANYCFTSPNQPTGLMLLSEVALGDMHELTKASFVTKVPDGKFSVKGVGKTIPNPDGFHTREDGVIVPCGKAITNDKLASELLYNEYIVYDVAQVNVQYLLKMKFNYQSRRK